MRRGARELIKESLPPCIRVETSDLIARPYFARWELLKVFFIFEGFDVLLLAIKPCFCRGVYLKEANYCIGHVFLFLYGFI